MVVGGGWWYLATTKYLMIRLLSTYYRVTVEGYKEIRTEARIFQYGPPSILDTSSSHSLAQLGGDAKLTCDSFAIPLPEKVGMIFFCIFFLVEKRHF